MPSPFRHDAFAVAFHMMSPPPLYFMMLADIMSYADAMLMLFRY